MNSVSVILYIIDVGINISFYFYIYVYFYIHKLEFMYIKIKMNENIIKEVSRLWKGREVKPPSKFFAFNKNSYVFLVGEDNTTIVSLVTKEGKSFLIPKKYLKSHDEYTYFINSQSNDDLLMTSCREPLNQCDKIAYEISLIILN